MGMSELLLQQQMKETQENLQKKYDDEDARQKKGGFWSSMGGGVGGLLGGLGAGALAGALGVATGGLAMPLIIGAGAGLGSLGGARIGADLGGGRQHDAIKLGQNVDALTGKTKEFSQAVKDRYRKNVNQFQDNLNTNILSQALNTGLKAGAFAYANPMIQKSLGKAGAKLGFGSGQPMTTASGELLSQGAPADIAAAQAYQPAGMASDTLIAPARAIQAPIQGPPAPNNLLNMASPPTSSMAGMGPLSNQAYDAASSVSNPFLPESVTNILGQSTNYAPAVNPQAYGNALNRAQLMQRIGLKVPSPISGNNPNVVGMAQKAMNQAYGNQYQQAANMNLNQLDAWLTGGN